MASRNDSSSAEFCRLRSSSDWRLPVVHRSQQVAVRTGAVLMLYLCRAWRQMSLAGGCVLFGGWARHCSTGTSVIADAVHGAGVFDYSRVVNIVNVGDVHIVDGLVVIELPSSPITAVVAGTGISVAVGDPTVVTDDRRPVAGMPVVQSVVKGPVTRRPKQFGLGGWHPRAGNPVVSIRTPGPVTGRPDIAFRRAKGLLINGQRRRSEVYRYQNLGR